MPMKALSMSTESRRYSYFIEGVGTKICQMGYTGTGKRIPLDIFDSNLNKLCTLHLSFCDLDASTGPSFKSFYEKVHKTIVEAEVINPCHILVTSDGKTANFDSIVSSNISSDISSRSDSFPFALLGYNCIGPTTDPELFNGTLYVFQYRDNTNNLITDELVNSLKAQLFENFLRLVSEWRFENKGRVES